jgi:hypothetical protein
MPRTTVEPALDYFDFLSSGPATEKEASFYWPVAPGDDWHPNIQRWRDPADPHPRFWTPRDLVHIMARPLRERRDGGKILYWYISIWGGDDHSVTTREVLSHPPKWRGHRLSLAEVRRILFDLPNPLSVAYVDGLEREGRPLFIMD